MADPLKFLNECCAFQYWMVRNLRKWFADQPDGKTLEDLSRTWYEYLASDTSSSLWKQVVDKAKAYDQALKQRSLVTEPLAGEVITETWRK